MFHRVSVLGLLVELWCLRLRIEVSVSFSS